MSNQAHPLAVAGNAIGSLGQVAVMAWAAFETDGVLRWLLWFFVAVILVGQAVKAGASDEKLRGGSA